MVHVLWLVIILMAGRQGVHQFPSHQTLIWACTAVLFVTQCVAWHAQRLKDARELAEVQELSRNMLAEMDELLKEPGDNSPLPPFDVPYYSPTTGRKLNDSPE